jgi:hypothetical protein
LDEEERSASTGNLAAPLRDQRQRREAASHAELRYRLQHSSDRWLLPAEEAEYRVCLEAVVRRRAVAGG